MTIVDPTIQATFAERRAAAFAPIVSAADPRYAALAELFVREDLGDITKLDARSLGVDYGQMIFEPAVPKVSAPLPKWATEQDDVGVAAGSSLPAAFWRHPLIAEKHFEAAIEQWVTQDPDTGDIEAIESPNLVVRMAGVDTEIDITRPQFAREYGSYLIAAADAWERIVAEAGA